MSNDPNKIVRDARIDKEVAEDVALGMAAKASTEQARADALASENVAQRSTVRAAAVQRDAAIVSGAVARESARNSSFATWLLLGTLAVALLIGAIWYSNRPEPVRDTVMINREAAPPTNPSAPPVAVQVQPSAPSVVVPVPVPQAAPAPRDRIIERQVPVPVPYPVPVPGPAQTQPRDQGTTSPRATDTGGTGTTEGATTPSTRGETTAPSTRGRTGSGPIGGGDTF